MKKCLKVVQYTLFVLIIISVLLTLIQVSGIRTPLSRFNYPVFTYQHNEIYDPSLARLDNMVKLAHYCDSLFGAEKKANPLLLFETSYPQVISQVVRSKFFHGYSNYSFQNNYMALLLEPFTGKQLSAIVIPDDIVKYPYAACSQQSIVAMDLLQRRGFTTRDVTFEKRKFDGHFCFESYYSGSWHFFDPDLEPNARILDAHNRPSIAELAANDSLLLAVYTNLSKEKTFGVFKKFSYSVPGKFPAPNALIYQKVTKFLSYTAWIFFLVALIVARWIYSRLKLKTGMRNNSTPVTQMHTGTDTVYNTAHGT